MTEQEAKDFFDRGRNIMTSLAIHLRQFDEWAAAFEARGGAAAMGSYGNDATQIVYINNDLQGALTPARRATINQLRTDY